MELGDMIDGLYALRQKRLEVQKTVDDLKSQEMIMRQQIMARLEEVGLQKASGSVATAGIKSSIEPQVVDWEAVHAWVRENDRFDLLQKRMNNLAWRGMYAEGIILPGTEPVQVFDLSLTKASR